MATTCRSEACSAYSLNLVESAIYLWVGIAVLDPRSQSVTVAWSKGLGTGMVSVFVFLEYPGNDFIQVLAVLVGLVDLIYMVVLVYRRRTEQHVSVSNRSFSSI